MLLTFQATEVWLFVFGKEEDFFWASRGFRHYLESYFENVYHIEDKKNVRGWGKRVDRL